MAIKLGPDRDGIIFKMDFDLSYKTKRKEKQTPLKPSKQKEIFFFFYAI